TPRMKGERNEPRGRMARFWLVWAAGILSIVPRVGAQQPPANPVNPQDVGSALTQCESAGPDGRRAAVEILTHSRDPRAVGALILALKDEDYEVRRSAVLGLWKLGPMARERLIGL